jgi:immune inhibitor A
VDNSTVWQPDYDRGHYERMYFGTGATANSVKKYYEKQSSGRYSVSGTVTDWVKVQYNEARYGRSNGYPCNGNVCTTPGRWSATRSTSGSSTSRPRAARWPRSPPS